MDNALRRLRKSGLMEEYPMISVIIPMYKCTSFVDSFMEGICNQTFKDIEIICIADGPDAELEEKLEEWTKKDERIQYHVIVHGGAGAARNFGLTKCKGKYLAFLDADDLNNQDFLEKLVSNAERYQTDISSCTYTHIDLWRQQTIVNNGYSLDKVPVNQVFTGDDVPDFMPSFINVTWNKLFLHQFVKDNQLRFSETTSNNDSFFVVAAMMSAKRIYVLKEDLLTARRHINADSISSNRAKCSEDYIVVMNELKDWLIAKGLWKKYKESYVEEFRRGAIYNRNYDYNEKYAEGLADTFVKDEPWKHFGNTELKDKAYLYRKPYIITRTAFKDELNAFKGPNDNGKRHWIHEMDNQILYIEKIREIMINKYNRDIWKKDNLFTALSWSLRKRGFSGTVQKIKEKLISEEKLEAKGVVCAGHLTMARKKLQFFMPYQIPANSSRSQVQIEKLSIKVRMEGYYPTCESKNKNEKFTEMGPSPFKLVNLGKTVNENGVKRIDKEIIPGFGIRISVIFYHPLLKNTNKDLAQNNCPASIVVYGKMSLK